MVTKELPAWPGTSGTIPPVGREDRRGFTIIEVMVAIVILAVGLLGLAGTTVLVIKQTTLADVATDRSVALQSTIEKIRATPFDSVSSGSEKSGLFEVAWSVQDGGRWKAVEVVTTGPGLRTNQGFPTISHTVADTFSYRIISP